MSVVKTLHTEHFHSSLARDVAGHVIGDHIGSGAYRDVYAYAIDPLRFVVKLENGFASFANHREWEVWKAIQETKLAQWFAPCKAISGNGVMLIQARTKPVMFTDLPKRVPAFFADLKADNWGRYKGRIVCHDYANHMMLERGITCGMKKAIWK